MEKTRDFIFWFLDIFYPLFKRFFNKQTYHYIACGGGNTVLYFVLFYASYHYLLGGNKLDLYYIALTPHIASFLIASAITLPIGFLLTKYIVWSESNIPVKVQLFRHLTFVGFSSILNYLLLKLLIEQIGWWPMPSQIITTIIIVIFSYLTQKHISFKQV